MNPAEEAEAAVNEGQWESEADNELEKLRGLKLQRAHDKPATGAVNGSADVGH